LIATEAISAVNECYSYLVYILKGVCPTGQISVNDFAGAEQFDSKEIDSL